MKNEKYYIHAFFTDGSQFIAWAESESEGLIMIDRIQKDRTRIGCGIIFIPESIHDIWLK